MIPFTGPIYYVPALGIKLFLFLEEACLLLKNNHVQHEINMAALFKKYKRRYFEIDRKKGSVGLNEWCFASIKVIFLQDENHKWQNHNTWWLYFDSMQSPTGSTGFCSDRAYGLKSHVWLHAAQLASPWFYGLGGLHCQPSSSQRLSCQIFQHIKIQGTFHEKRRVTSWCQYMKSNMFHLVWCHTKIHDIF